MDRPHKYFFVFLVVNKLLYWLRGPSCNPVIYLCFLWPLSHIKYADWTSNGLSSSNHRRSSVHQRLLCLCGLELARRWFLAIFRQTTQNIDSYLIYFLATNREIIMCVLSLLDITLHFVKTENSPPLFPPWTKITPHPLVNEWFSDSF